MIKQILLKNFQIHKKLKIDLHENFTCIRGGNNHGKSSVIRALRWLFENSPRGDWMCRRSKSGKLLTAIVKVVLKDDTVIKRVKGKDKNYYVVNGEEYHEIGGKIPKEVADALNLDKSLLTEINKSLHIDGQDDDTFLVFDSGPNKARAVNIITGTNNIEKSILSFNKDKLRTNKERKFNKKKCEEHKVEADNIDGVLEQIKIDKINGTHDSVLSSVNMIETLLKLQEEYEAVSQTIGRYKNLHKIYGRLLKADDIIIAIKELSFHDKQINLWKNKLEEIKSVGVPSEVEFDKMESLLTEISNKEKEINKLEYYKNRLSELSELMVSLKSKILDYTKELKKYNGTNCPVCGSQIKNMLNYVG